MISCQNGRELCVQVLIKARAAINTQDSKDGWSALMFAAQDGHSLCAKVSRIVHAAYLIKTAASSKVAQVSWQGAQVLIDANANINASSNDGWSALILACQNGHGACAEVQLESSCLSPAFLLCTWR